RRQRRRRLRRRAFPRFPNQPRFPKPRARRPRASDGHEKTYDGISNLEVALLLSMTGFGDARFQDQRWSIQVEVRTVNNRHLKLSTKISEPYTALEAELEHLVRERVRRGTVQISMRIDRPRQAEDYKLNTVALASYREQLKAMEVCGGGGGALDL